MGTLWSKDVQIMNWYHHKSKYRTTWF